MCIYVDLEDARYLQISLDGSKTSCVPTSYRENRTDNSIALLHSFVINILVTCNSIDLKKLPFAGDSTTDMHAPFTYS